MDDVFASCNEATAQGAMRYGLFEWESRAELTPGQTVVLAITWLPEDGVPLADVVAAARISWQRIRAAEPFHRRAAAEEVNGPRPWLRIRAEDMHPTDVVFLADGSAEICYAGIETGGHLFVVEISAAGQYVGYRLD